jgi:hypothetical protein
MKLYWRIKKEDGTWTYRPASAQLADKVRKMGYGPQYVEAGE